MAQVSVTIAGRLYRMACEEGQEAQLEALGVDVDRRIAQMRSTFGEIGDQRLTVMAAIALMDELNEAKRALAKMDGEMQVLRDKSSNAKIEAQIWTTSVVESIDTLTRRVEAMAKHFNSTAK